MKPFALGLGLLFAGAIPLKAAACEAQVTRVSFAQDGASVNAKFKVHAPVGSVVTVSYMVHASDSYGEMHHIMGSGKVTVKQEDDVVTLTTTRPIIKTSGIVDVSFEEAKCTVPPGPEPKK